MNISRVSGPASAGRSQYKVGTILEASFKPLARSWMKYVIEAREAIKSCCSPILPDEIRLPINITGPPLSLECTCQQKLVLQVGAAVGLSNIAA